MATSTSSLSTHVLDTSRGSPAAGIGVTLSALDADPQVSPRTFTTDPNGRIGELLIGGVPGRYQLAYDLGTYLPAKEGQGLYPLIEISLVLDPDRHHHVVLTLSQGGYFVACVPS